MPSVCQSAQQLLIILSIFQVDPKSMFTLLIEPRLTYCVEVWCSAYKYSLQPLCVKQKHVIHLLRKTGYLEHTAELFRSFYMLCFHN